MFHPFLHKEGASFQGRGRKLALTAACCLMLLSCATSRGATFAPSFYDAYITNRVDLDGDGYARQFVLLFDVDSNIAGQYYVRIYEYDGGFGFDDFLGTTPTYSVNGDAVDYHGVQIVCSDFPGTDFLSHGIAEFRLDLYNAANNSLVQSWTPSNDGELGSVPVELSSEDSVPVLTIASVWPAGTQPLAWEQSVTYTVTVRDTNGSPVSGVMLSGTNGLVATNFTSNPMVTDANGQMTATFSVPLCIANGLYNVSFIATKGGYLSSQAVIRQVQVVQAPNRNPNAPASGIAGQPAVLRIGEVYSIAADYTDPDGSNDVRYCYLRLGHPTTPLEFRYETKTGALEFLTPNAQPFVSPISIGRIEIPNGVRLSWNFFLKRAWPLTSGGIDFAIRAEDRCGLTDGWNGDGSSRSYETPPYGSTVIIHGFQPTASLPEWERTMGGRIAERLGNGEVYEYEPADAGFSRLPQFSVGTNSVFEKVFLFNWADESDNISTGFAEAAADAFFASLIRLQRANPYDHLLSRIHFIGHSRGCIVASEMIERFGALSRDGTDTNILGFPIDTQIDATYLDPHSTGTFLTGDFGDPDVNLPYLTNRGVVAWSNVGHANNYYQNQDDPSVFELFYLNGEFVRGARNRNLDQPALAGIDHSEVHAWYFGSIDPEATDDEIAAMISEERSIQAASAAASFGIERGSEVDFTAASVTIQRAQWYLDRLGVIEGYSHTRQGGEFSHSDIREPLDATPRPSVFHDFIADGVFNGEFKHGTEQIVDMPGWDRHVGGGAGDLNAGHLRLFGGAIPTASSYRRHNILFVPVTARQLSFRCRVFQADPRAVPNADRLVVRIGNSVILGGAGSEFWLTQAAPNFRRLTCDVPQAARGNAATLTVEIVPGGSTANAEVWIDDVAWLDGNYLNLTADQLASGEVRLSMRGKLLSRYALESSPDLTSWTTVTVLTNVNGTVRYTDSNPGQNRRFYRAVLLP